MSYDFLYEINEGIATLTLNRPEVMNALTFDIYAQLRNLFETLRHDETVRAIILTGAGDNFCSGGDVHQIIGELLKRDMKAHLEFTRMTGAVVQNMRLLDKPIIAALNGMTAGAGAVLALASDLRIASDGEETLQLVASWKPDLLLLDIMMPRLSGFEVCRHLRADPATRAAYSARPG